MEDLPKERWAPRDLITWIAVGFSYAYSLGYMFLPAWTEFMLVAVVVGAMMLVARKHHSWKVFNWREFWIT